MGLNSFDSTGYFFDLLSVGILLVPVYHLLRQPFLKRALLTLAGLFLLYGVAPRLALFHLAFWSLVFVLQRFMAATGEGRWSVPALWTCLVLCLLPMVAWKLWADDFTRLFNLWTNSALRPFSLRLWELDLTRDVIVPIGLSFATFRGVDLLVKTWLGRFVGLRWHELYFYGLFPPVQVVGPIMEYDEIAVQEPSRAELPADLQAGVVRIAIGLVKVLVLAGMLQGSTGLFEGFVGASPLSLWLGLFGFTWYFYLNFSGYSDLAIGAARLFGFRIKENFNFPFLQPSVADFWNNWHMSLSRFAQRHAFVPLGGYRPRTQYVALVGTILVIALWHDLTEGMLVFAVYHGVGLMLHRLYRNTRRSAATAPLPRLVSVPLTYLFVALSFPLLALPLDAAAPFYRALLGLA
jgi:D-alanyl-lipoteichoic acid acyltransferase DltB (MBOAT superfamily)